jgi:hypothetical protein
MMPPGLDEEGQYQSDTIEVKCEPSRLSSPEVMSSELEPLVNHLLAQMNPSHHHQQLESPEPVEGEMNFNHNAYATPQLSQPAQRTPRLRQKPQLTMEERLQLMPEKRPLPWRPGVEAGADNETGGESRRKQIRFGCLLATRGEVQAVPCNSCTNGRGKFEICVALEGFFKGACASCQLSGRPNRCSIKEQDGKVVFIVMVLYHALIIIGHRRCRKSTCEYTSKWYSLYQARNSSSTEYHTDSYRSTETKT